jgi:hypothetical protein
MNDKSFGDGALEPFRLDHPDATGGAARKN